MVNHRKRTGARKRQQQRRLGAPRPPDESRVTTPQSASTFWINLGRSELATGYSVRAASDEDLAAFPHVVDACRKHGVALAGRMLPKVLVAGIEPVARQLE